MLYSDVEENSVLLVVDDDTTSTVCVANKERRPRKDTRHAGPPAKRICLPRSVDALARLLNKHNNRPRCLRPPTVPTCSQLGDTRATST